MKSEKPSRPLIAAAIFGVVIASLAITGSRQDPSQSGSTGPLSWNLLIPDSASMARAWEFPRDPRVDTGGLDSSVAAEVIRGFLLFTNTPKMAPRLTGGRMTCNNCHPNGGQRNRANPLVGVAEAFPEYNKRAGRVFSLEDRIVGCFMRSMNETGVKEGASKKINDVVSPETKEVRALAAYIRWLSRNGTVDQMLPWRGHNKIPASSLLPLNRLSPTKGRKLFREKCVNCHGEDGQGVFIGDKRPGPLWGPNSWNDGAGAARTYTLAGIIRYWMPYMNPGSLTDEEAQHIAAYITSQQRPGFPFKKNDYLKEPIPKDAVYYPQLYSRNPFFRR